MENFKKGFTIIELVVVTAVFLFIIGAAIGIFISVVQNQKKVLAEQQLINQISYVEEYMSKALRVAKKSDGGTCIPTGYIYLLTRYDTDKGLFGNIKFINQSDNNTCAEFFLDTDGILKEIKNGAASPVALTPASIKINYAKFSVNGSDGSASGCADPNSCGASETDDVQPRVTMLLNISIPGENYGRTIQTTVSQRNLNVK